eukprot:TRINITY_DN6913_c0_g1_i2.p1 TRINITY_DN6913_c0_g1~~TRINITY_DN6913_c0_g1_i2.p1  ORF type:complete len:151 (-),score=38.68 TRINITY_DN6913_c0_g1_i2:450-902(-)
MPVRRLLLRYSEWMERSPIHSNMATGGMLWLLGDVISQRFEGKTFREMDPKRLGIMAVYGTVVAGPLYSVWYRVLERWTLPLAHSRWKHIGVKILADQFVFEIPYLAAFFTIINALEGKPFRSAVDKIKADYVSTYLTDWAVWPAYQVPC